MKVWCVRHRTGTCATSRQARPPTDGDDSVRTKCGYFVVLPWGISRGAPDCGECKAVLKRGVAEE